LERVGNTGGEGCGIACEAPTKPYGTDDLFRYIPSGVIKSVGKKQCSETNVMHFLLRINGLYMFRALLALPQEALHKWHLVY
jgi:hypothetical protein